MKLSYQRLFCLFFLLGLLGCKATNSAKPSSLFIQAVDRNEAVVAMPLFSYAADGKANFVDKSAVETPISGRDSCINDSYLQESLRKISGYKPEETTESYSKMHPYDVPEIADLVEFVRSQDSAYSGTVGPLHLSSTCQAFLAAKGSRLERLFYARGVYDNSATFINCQSNTPFCSRTTIDGPQTGRRMEEVLMAYLPYVPDFPKLEFIDRISRAYDLEAERSGFAPWQYKDVKPCPQVTSRVSNEYYDCFLLRDEILDNIVSAILLLHTVEYRMMTKEFRVRTGQYISCSDLLKVRAFYSGNSKNLDYNKQIEHWLSNTLLECDKISVN
jgi:hypothetical protein